MSIEFVAEQRFLSEIRSGLSRSERPKSSSSAPASLASYGTPDIFNTDQGYQFPNLDFTGLLKDNYIQISMAGKHCCRDNVLVKRLWKSVKYEAV